MTWRPRPLSMTDTPQRVNPGSDSHHASTFATKQLFGTLAGAATSCATTRCCLPRSPDEFGEMLIPLFAIVCLVLREYRFHTVGMER